MSMHVSMAQALGIWADLCDACHGKGWGGDVAQIYMFRLMPDNPNVAGAKYLREHSALSREALEQQIARANAALYDLLSMFAQERSCSIKVEGRRLGAWLRNAGYDHRVHVKVVPK